DHGQDEQPDGEGESTGAHAPAGEAAREEGPPPPLRVRIQLPEHGVEDASDGVAGVFLQPAAERSLEVPVLVHPTPLLAGGRAFASMAARRPRSALCSREWAVPTGMPRTSATRSSGRS